MGRADLIDNLPEIRTNENKDVGRIGSGGGRAIQQQFVRPHHFQCVAAMFRISDSVDNTEPACAKMLALFILSDVADTGQNRREGFHWAEEAADLNRSRAPFQLLKAKRPGVSENRD
jgi:hypothetical protein